MNRIGNDRLYPEDRFRSAGSIILPAAGGGTYTLFFRLDRTSRRILSAKWQRAEGTDWLDSWAQAVCFVVIGQPVSTVVNTHIHDLIPYVSDSVLETVLSDPDVAAFMQEIQTTPPRLEVL